MRRPAVRLGLGSFVLIAAVIPAVAASASAAAAPPDPTVDTIVSDYIAARGGLQRIRSIQTLRQKGHAFADAGREAIVMRELKRPDKVRFEFTVQGITAAYVSDGRQGWQVAPFSGDMDVRPMSEAALTDAMEQADIEGPLVDWKAKGHKVTLEGHAAVGERDAFKLRVDLKSGEVRYDYIDVKTHYQLRIESTRELRGRRVQLETTFGDHKKTAGVLFPRTVEVAAVGRPQRMRVVVDSIEVNPPLSDARFQRIKPAE